MGIHYLQARALGHKLIREGSFLVSRNGYEPPAGVVVHEYKEKEQRQPASSGMSAIDIMAYIAMHDPLLKKPNHYMRGSYDKGSGEFVYEIVMLGDGK